MSMTPGDGKPLLDRPTNPICKRCGLCCCLLSAYVNEEDRKAISEENDLPVKKFCQIEKKGVGPNPGKHVLHQPCRFLLGRPMDYVSCRIYKKTRPEVCSVYLCRVAIQYKLGVVELNEGLHLLGRAYAEGRTEIFNWIGGTGEKELQESMVMGPLREEAAKMVEEFGEDGKLGELDEEEVGNILIAKSTTPSYLVHSDFAHLELNLLLNFFDRGDHELKDVIPEKVIAGWNEGEKNLAMVVYTNLLRKLRSLFRTVDEMKAEEPEVVDKGG